MKCRRGSAEVWLVSARSRERLVLLVLVMLVLVLLLLLLSNVICNVVAC